MCPNFLSKGPQLFSTLLYWPKLHITTSQYNIALYHEMVAYLQYKLTSCLPCTRTIGKIAM